MTTRRLIEEAARLYLLGRDTHAVEAWSDGQMLFRVQRS